MKNITVLGASGFIGSHLVDRLIDNGYFVKILIRRPLAELNIRNIKNHRLKIYNGEIENIDLLTTIISKDDIVFDLASPSTPYSSSQFPVTEISDHIIPHVSLLQRIYEIVIKKFIFISSGGGLYGGNYKRSIKETDIVQPMSPHAIGKATIEYYMNYFSHKYNIPQLIFRVSNPYGPGQVQKNGFGLIPTLFSCIRDNVQPILYDNGEAIRDFIYIDDLIDAMISSFDKINLYHTYNIGSGRGTKINEAWSVIKKLTKSDIFPILAPKRDFDINRYVLNVDKFSTEFQWISSTTLSDGLKNTWEWINSSKNKL